MPLLKSLALFLGIAAIPVITLARAAIAIVWAGSLSLSTAVLMVALVGGFLFGISFVATKLVPGSGVRAVAVVGWFSLAFFHVGPIRGIYTVDWSRWHWVALVAAAAGIAFWLGTRIDSEARYLLSLVPVLVALQAVLFVTDLSRSAEPEPAAVSATESSVGSPPSIWFIVLDAHPSPRSLVDNHDVDLTREIARLETAGFRVWDDARVSYSVTLVSIPSLLTGETWGPTTVDQSHATILAGLNGDTPLVAALKEAGLSFRMISPNWSRSTCGKLVDVCVSPPRYNDHWWFLLRSTPLPDLLPTVFAHPWPQGGVRTLGEIANMEPSSSRHFTFVHSLASHPPRVLNESCEVSPTDGNLGSQLRCTHDVLIKALGSIDLESDVVIITSDHGDRVGDINAPIETWSDAMARDRFSAFTAISTPRGCEDALPTDLSGAQLLPYVLNCYGADLPIPPHRFIKVGQRDFWNVEATELSWDGWSTYSP